MAVTATNADGTNYAESNPTSAVAAAPAGTREHRCARDHRAPPRPATRLTVSNGTWSGSPTTYQYQWERCNSSGAGCVAISGAQASTYGLTASDVGHEIVAEVAATNVGGDSSYVSLETDERGRGVGDRQRRANDHRHPGRRPDTQGNDRPLLGHRSQVRLRVGEAVPSTDRPPAASEISGATSPTYVIAAADAGLRLLVVTAAYNTADAALEVSALTGPVLDDRRPQELAERSSSPRPATTKSSSPRPAATAFTVTAPVAGKLALTWTLKGTKIASGSVSTAGGRTTLKLKLTSAGQAAPESRQEGDQDLSHRQLHVDREHSDHNE